MKKKKNHKMLTHPPVGVLWSLIFWSVFPIFSTLWRKNQVLWNPVDLPEKSESVVGSLLESFQFPGSLSATAQHISPRSIRLSKITFFTSRKTSLIFLGSTATVPNGVILSLSFSGPWKFWTKNLCSQHQTYREEGFFDKLHGSINVSFRPSEPERYDWLFLTYLLT